MTSSFLPILLMSVTATALFFVGLQLNQHRLNIKRGPRCASCALYKQACRGSIEDSNQTPISITAGD